MADIESVIANSISGLEGAESSDSGDTNFDVSSDAGTDEGAQFASEEGTSDTEGVAEGAAPAAEAAVEDDALAKELGLNPKRRDNRIPYSRVQQIIKKREEKAAADVAALNERLQGYSQYESPEFQQALGAWQMLDQDPERFLSALGQADERYARLLRREEASEARRAAQSQVDDTEVQPDVMLPDGSLGYSPQAVQRMAAQQAQRVALQVKQELEQAYGPMRQAYETHQQATALRAQAEQRVSAKLQEAQTWPGFKEHEAEMLTAIQNDRSITNIEQAYFKVVLPKLAANRDAVYKEALASVNRKPRGAAASVIPKGTPSPGETPRTMEDIIRESIAGLE